MAWGLDLGSECCWLGGCSGTGCAGGLHEGRLARMLECEVWGACVRDAGCICIKLKSSSGGTWELRLRCLRIYGLGSSHLGLKLSLGLLSLGDSSGLLVGRIHHMDIDQFPHRNGGSLTGPC